jgi:cytochrome c-type biogenesis protein CcmF
VYLVATRLRDLEATAELESMVSREAAFLYNNLLLVGISFSVLWGTLFPILSEWVRGTNLFGFGFALVLLLAGMRNVYALLSYLLSAFVAATIVQEFSKGIGARRVIHGESYPLAFVRLVARNRRRYGGYIVHAGIVMLFAAFAGLAFRSEHDVSLAAGQEFNVTDPYGRQWRFVSQGVSTSQSLNREITAVALETWRDGENLGLLSSEKRQYFDSQRRPTFEPSTEVGIRSDAELRITFNPLVVWVWVGGALMAIGGLVVMWPQAERRRQSGYAASLRPAVVEPETVGAA